MPLVKNSRTGKLQVPIPVTVAEITVCDNDGNEVTINRPLPALMTIEEAKINTLAYFKNLGGPFEASRYSDDMEDVSQQVNQAERVSEDIEIPAPRHVVIVDYRNGESVTSLASAFIKFR